MPTGESPEPGAVRQIRNFPVLLGVRRERRLGNAWSQWLAIWLAVIIPTLAPGQSTDALEQALFRARSAARLLVVAWVCQESSDGPDIDREVAGPAWQARLAPHETLVLRASKAPQQARRFDAREPLVFLILDGDGRELARIRGTREFTAAAEEIVQAIEAAHRHEQASRDLGQDPQNIEALYWVGTSCWNRGERVLAVDYFERLASQPENDRLGTRELLGEALRRLGEWELDAGRFEQAEKRYRASVENTRDAQLASRSTLGLSLSLRRQGRLRDAIAILERHFHAPQPLPGSEEALFTLGYLYLETGERDTGVRHLLALAERFPTSIYAQRARRQTGQAPAYSFRNPDAVNVTTNSAPTVPSPSR